jgi:hypothetical protein
MVRTKSERKVAIGGLPQEKETGSWHEWKGAVLTMVGPTGQRRVCASSTFEHN